MTPEQMINMAMKLDRQDPIPNPDDVENPPDNPGGSPGGFMPGNKFGK